MAQAQQRGCNDAEVERREAGQAAEGDEQRVHYLVASPLRSERLDAQVRRRGRGSLRGVCQAMPVRPRRGGFRVSGSRRMQWQSAAGPL